MSINRAILLGHVGGDPDIRNANSGDQVATFSLATPTTRATRRPRRRAKI